MLRPWLPWFLTAGAFGIFLLVLASDGLTLVLTWGVVILAYRGSAALGQGRTLRLWLDALFALVCVLAAFEGGWYLIPAAAAFSRADWRRSPG